jgi:oligopeptide/dipeptide ABC transporter ATP-binding protein
VNALLQVRDLTTLLKIGNDIWTIVDHMNFDLYSGQTVALVGESGSGKSLTALSIMGILPTPPALPPTGSILYKEKNLLTISEREMRKIRGSKIAMVFQDPMSALNPVYTVGNQLIEVLLHHQRIPESQAWLQSVEALHAVGIDNPEERMLAYPHELSGGLKQRVMIAMALLCEPDILIADEPTTALDITIQAQILTLIRSLQKKNGMAVLLITHDMGIVSQIADEVIVMYLAQSIEKTTATALFEHPYHPYTQGLLNSRPSSINRKKALQPIMGHVPSFRHIPSGCRFHPRCPYVMEICKKGPVPNFEVNPEHMAKCWLYKESDSSS